MIAGGLFGDTPASSCKGSIAFSLFDEFQSLDSQLRTLNQTGEDPVVKVGKEKEMKLSHQSFWGGRLEAYSRTIQMDDGKWVIVQIRRWSNVYAFVAVDLFDDKGKIIASVKDSKCDGSLAVPFKDIIDGKDVLIRGALRAVTGKDFEVEAVE